MQTVHRPYQRTRYVKCYSNPIQNFLRFLILAVWFIRSPKHVFVLRRSLHHSFGRCRASTTSQLLLESLLLLTSPTFVHWSAHSKSKPIAVIRFLVLRDFFVMEGMHSLYRVILVRGVPAAMRKKQNVLLVISARCLASKIQ